MSTAKLFINGGGQGVWLPKDAQFDGLGDGVVEVEVTRQGKSIVLTPKPQPPADSAQADKQAPASGDKEQTLMDLISSWPYQPGLADIDLDSLIPPRSTWGPHPAPPPDVPD